MDDSAIQRVGELLPSGRPEWSSINFDIFCPRCDYNLRGLEKARCPECGLEFDWNQAFTRALASNDMLFEQNMDRRPIRSWLSTTKKALRIRSFWEGVSIHDSVRTRALLVYAATVIIAAMALFHGICYGLAYGAYHLVQGCTPPPPKLLVRIQYQLDRAASVSLISDVRPGVLLFGGALFLIGTVLTLVSLRQTLFRFRLRSAQVLRVCVYSLPRVLAFGVVAGLLMCCTVPLFALTGPLPLSPLVTNRWYMVMNGQYSYFTSGVLSGWELSAYYGIPLLFLLGCVATLRIGLQRYLKLPHGGLTAAITIFTAALFGMTGSAVLGVWIGGGW